MDIFASEISFSFHCIGVIVETKNKQKDKIKLPVVLQRELSNIRHSSLYLRQGLTVLPMLAWSLSSSASLGVTGVYEHIHLNHTVSSTILSSKIIPQVNCIEIHGKDSQY